MAVPPALEGFTDRSVDVDGVRLHIVEGGTGRERPPLVLVHGWPQHWWIWRAILPALARHYHVVAVDLRGHGWSAAPPARGDAYDKRVLARELLALLDELGLERPVLVGHDWGGWVSLLAASLAPERVRGVVAVAIVAPWARIPVRELWRFGYQLIAGGPLGYLAHTALKQRFLRWVFTLGAGRGRRLTKDEKKVYLERFREPARARAGVAMYRRFLTHEMPAVLRGGYARPVPPDVPVLLLAGRGDGVLTPSLVRRGAAANVEVRVIENAGHWVPEQQPEVVVEHIERFVSSLEV
ncbi:alpha/beta fold hydrolase [uncultured Aeromicrobium sp.]|uniref:alpha/beta fold hydrolase n=1 Tax=uncultured Aeromicrobium sp. TaxID=337820 RepID=UPI0025E442C9|nr:alpha/beta hydrolase [uncultured Aeromicrobium sp.]